MRERTGNVRLWTTYELSMPKYVAFDINDQSTQFQMLKKYNNSKFVLPNPHSLHCLWSGTIPLKVKVDNEHHRALTQIKSH